MRNYVNLAVPTMPLLVADKRGAAETKIIARTFKEGGRSTIGPHRPLDSTANITTPSPRQVKTRSKVRVNLQAVYITHPAILFCYFARVVLEYRPFLL
jgi:hypothetical protein